MNEASAEYDKALERSAEVRLLTQAAKTRYLTARGLYESAVESSEYKMTEKQEATYTTLRHMGYEYDRTEGDVVIVLRKARTMETTHQLDEKQIYPSGDTKDPMWPKWDDSLGYPHLPR